jgi:hypothetical protein
LRTSASACSGVAIPASQRIEAGRRERLDELAGPAARREHLALGIPQPLAHALGEGVRALSSAVASSAWPSRRAMRLSICPSSTTSEFSPTSSRSSVCARSSKTASSNSGKVVHRRLVHRALLGVHERALAGGEEPCSSTPSPLPSRCSNHQSWARPQRRVRLLEQRAVAGEEEDAQRDVGAIGGCERSTHSV